MTDSGVTMDFHIQPPPGQAGPESVHVTPGSAAFATVALIWSFPSARTKA